jgi:hypothetical protein
MAILIFIFHLCLIFFIAFRLWKRETVFRSVFWPLLLIKLAAGICLGLLYLYYFPVADTFDYFKDASKLQALALRNLSQYAQFLLFNTGLDSLDLTFNQPRALFLTKITSVFNILTGNNYWLISLYFSLISFSGAWFLVKTINRFVFSVAAPAVIAFLLLPSVVFWTSGVIKETFAMAALFYLSAIFLKVWYGERPTVLQYLAVAIGLWVLWNLKYYFMAIFLPVVCTSLLYKFIIGERFQRSAVLEIAVWFAMLILPVFLITFLHPNFYPDRLLNVIVLNNAGYNELSSPDDVVHFSNLKATVPSILSNAPWALFSGLFRPLLWESGTVLQFLLGLENAVLLLFFVAALRNIKKIFMSPYRLLVLALLMYVLLLCILITLAAPNFGTLSRYRSGYLSFFVFLILCNNPILQYLERSFQRLVRH